jgi:hypothetical protein
VSVTMPSGPSKPNSVMSAYSTSHTSIAAMNTVRPPKVSRYLCACYKGVTRVLEGC